MPAADAAAKAGDGSLLLEELGPLGPLEELVLCAPAGVGGSSVCGKLFAFFFPCLRRFFSNSSCCDMLAVPAAGRPREDLSREPAERISCDTTGLR